MAKHRQKLLILRVFGLPARKSRGLIVAGGVAYPCALGRGGLVRAKREGDGGTPRGRLALRPGFFRADRGGKVATALALRATRRTDAWCDDPADRRYNRLIMLPKGASEERLWRADRLYDIVVPLGWNDGPVRRGRGSAIFWHVCREGFGPTAGCVAVEPAVFRKLLPRLSPKAVMVIG
jgi:L,D-peptidoglycan transpeptidase YkuD (ErfK/YbiS/YcfS/YnhG family)